MIGFLMIGKRLLSPLPTLFLIFYSLCLTISNGFFIIPFQVCTLNIVLLILILSLRLVICFLSEYMY